MSGRLRQPQWWGMVLSLVLILVGLWGYMAHRQREFRVMATVNQAEVGHQLFHALCATCHGPGGNGAGGAPVLNDGQTLAKYRTTSSLAQFIQTHMPASDPGILTSQQAVDLALWIKALNHALPTS